MHENKPPLRFLNIFFIEQSIADACALPRLLKFHFLLPLEKKIKVFWIKNSKNDGSGESSDQFWRQGQQFDEGG